MTSSGLAGPRCWPAGRARRHRQLISLTPLIDVVFILLVFFMLASSFLDWRSIGLTAPQAGDAGATIEGALLVEVRAQGVRLAGRPVTEDELERQLRVRLAEKPDQTVFVKAGQGVPLQRVVSVLDRLTAAGATGLSLIRDRAR